jgi:hypothetical protein
MRDRHYADKGDSSDRKDKLIQRKYNIPSNTQAI